MKTVLLGLLAVGLALTSTISVADEALHRRAPNVTHANIGSHEALAMRLGQFVYIVSPNGKQVLAPNQRLAEVDDQAKPIGFINLPTHHPRNWVNVDNKLVGSQSFRQMNRVRIVAPKNPIANCSACWEIQYTDKNGRWTLGVLKTDLYSPKQFVNRTSDKTRTLPAGTPVWQRFSGDLGEAYGQNDASRLVLQPHTTMQDGYWIREVVNGQATKRILANSDPSDQLFNSGKALTSSWWTSYYLTDQQNGAPGQVFKVKQATGLLSVASIGFSEKDALDKGLYNIDVEITPTKAADDFVTGISFSLAQNGVSSSEFVRTPGYIALLPRVYERLVFGNPPVVEYPESYDGTLPGVIFAVRGAVSGCRPAGEMPTPLTGIHSQSIGSDPQNTSGYDGWRICQIRYNWEEGKTYRLRLWILSNQGTPNQWGAWISEVAENAADIQIGTLTMPSSEVNQRIYAAQVFNYMTTPRPCGELGQMNFTLAKILGRGVQQYPGTITSAQAKACSSQVTSQCSGATCTLATR